MPTNRACRKWEALVYATDDFQKNLTLRQQSLVTAILNIAGVDDLWLNEMGFKSMIVGLCLTTLTFCNCLIVT
jgi:hypothetical protein